MARKTGINKSASSKPCGGEDNLWTFVNNTEDNTGESLTSNLIGVYDLNCSRLIKNFPKLLSKPILVIGWGEILGRHFGLYGLRKSQFNAALKMRHKQIEEIRLKKLDLLADHYGLDKTSPKFWQDLSWLLLIHHVDGFKVREKSKLGPKTKWDDAVLFRLWHEIEIVGKPKGKSARETCSHLITKEPWKSLVGSAMHKQNALYHQYKNSKQSQFVLSYKKALEIDPVIIESGLFHRLLQPQSARKVGSK